MSFKIVDKAECACGKTVDVVVKLLNDKSSTNYQQLSYHSDDRPGQGKGFCAMSMMETVKALK